MKKPEFIPLVAIGVLISLGSAVFVIALSFDAPWSISEINDRLGVVIPHDAANLIISGHHGLSDGIGVEFDAPPAIAEQFAKQFCEGKLYRGYDPFNAVDVYESVPNAHQIELGLAYFSYSPETSDTTFGNRCLPIKTDQYLQVVLETANPDFYHVKVEQFFSCTSCGYGGYLVTTPTEAVQPNR